MKVVQVAGAVMFFVVVSYVTGNPVVGVIATVIAVAIAGEVGRG